MRPPLPPRRLPPPSVEAGSAPDAVAGGQAGAVAVVEHPDPGVAGSLGPVRPDGSVTTALSERLAERTAARRHLTRMRLAVLATVLVVGAVLAYLVLFSPVLALEPGASRIEGTGTVVDPEAVAALVAAQEGTPLARVDVSALESRIGRLNGVKAVSVSRSWPHGLDVAITSREPVALVPRDDGGFALLDPEGVQVGVADRAPDGLPVVDVPVGEPGAAALTAVLTVLGSLPPDLLVQVSDAGATSADTVRFALSDGARVEWGSADSTALKLRVLEVLRQRPASVYDVSAPTMPVTR